MANFPVKKQLFSIQLKFCLIHPIIPSFKIFTSIMLLYRSRRSHSMKERLKSCYQFSDYQIAQLEFFFKTVFSEISQILIMSFLFRKELDVYFVALLSLCLLRTSTGGLHCKTYPGCLFASTVYMLLTIKLLPTVPVLLTIKIAAMLLCIPVNYLIGPVTSDVHMPLSEKVIQKGRFKSALFIAVYIVIIIGIPNSRYSATLFWITIIHTLQLIAAKIRKIWKGGKN